MATLRRWSNTQQCVLTGVRPRCVRRAVPLLAAQRRGAHRRVLASAQRCSRSQFRRSLRACAPMNRRALAVARVTTAVAVRSRVNARAYLRAATTAAAAGLDGADLTAHCGLRAHGSVWPLPWLRQSKRCGAGCGEVEGTVRSHALIGLFVTPKSAAPRSTAAAGCTVTLVSTRVRPYPKAVAQ